MAEAQVLKLLQQHNKPFSIQGIVDFMQQHGIKKAQIQKALESLTAAGTVIAKDFGKTKIYMPPQADLKVMSKEDMDEMKGRLKALQQQIQQETAEARELESELKEWNNSMSEEQLAAAIQDLTGKVAHAQSKLTEMRSGAVLVTEEQRKAIEKSFMVMLDHYRKRKGIFNSIWSSVSENMEGKQADLFEEMGIDSDEAVGAVTVRELEQLLPKRRKL